VIRSHNFLKAKPEDNRPLGRKSFGWNYDIKVDLKERDQMVSTVVIWLGVRTSSRIVNTVMNLWVLYKAANFLST
jgi:hypothetical protein